MNKNAYFKMFGLNKKATTPGEQFASAYVTGMFPYAGLINAAGDLGARFGGNAESTEDYENSAVGWIPGVSAYRLGRRRNQAAKLIGAKKNQAINQFLGSLTGTLAGGAVGGVGGGAIGAALGGGQGAAIGAGVGAGVGAIAPHVVAALAALISKKRTIKQQKQYEENGGLANYLVPGAPVYNTWKNLGFLMGDEYKQHRQKAYAKNKKEKKNQDKA